VPVQPAAVELLAALSPVLARWGRWYVFGAQAVTAYGVPRLSADVDVTLALHPDTPDRFARDMEAAGSTMWRACGVFMHRRLTPSAYDAHCDGSRRR